ncbi:protein of unknown function [Roseibium suaedae]|uniref:DUF4304 domain-containing protein n=2 Tax=Roseibium suaedae TaxID=735517 RepID=A0A1M7B940_9HYPH|nr:protein of unknown function [Roseibium suaedae]
MVPVSEPFSNIISNQLKGLGFKKKNRNWYFENDEVILVANLQKSSYGSQYYLNGGVYLRELGNEIFPKEYRCHIRFRLTSLLSGEEVERADIVFNLEDRGVSQQQREEAVVDFMKSVFVPELQRYSTKDQIISSLRKGSTKRYFVHRDVVGFLG